ncbi:2-dehydropantoate 2-reductase [Acetobacter cibinongensis]|uniref:2-dehydropantoate 2-reductase n=1 Tax=Acetobacter cibinongensis TaxID=146475 RepID=A0A0D6N3X6_9PROT|nr:2-dehydropantoate 2-reductase [Acetobacter cibinongensis]GAN60664.1 ketopantoate reductase ApbA/PanE [Acetobacter cibinongensis]GBQ11808.1 ketopantoate reductase [Acetobacter cibinongensis NRIC 0482]GEL58695.1 2-dehydropantoate 2-reductase [Acetobacter cibinongensis]
MHVVVIGAGAIGSYVGAALAQSGHDVTFLARPAQCEALRVHGLKYDTANGQQSVSVKVVSQAQDLRLADFVLVCVKSADTDQAGRDLIPALQPSTVIFSLQNGVENVQSLETVIHRPVVPVAVYIAVSMLAAGHVVHHGGNRLVMGEADTTETSANNAALFAQAGFAVTVSSQIMTVLWEKLMVNCAYNGLSALSQMPYARMMQTDGVQDVMVTLVQECQAVACALGIPSSPDFMTNLLTIASAMPEQMSSTAQDLRRGKPTEIEALNGYIVRKGRELGVVTPANQVILVLTRLAEQSHCLAR